MPHAPCCLMCLHKSQHQQHRDEGVCAQGMEEFDALEKGSWSELPTGGHVWRLRIVSWGASSHTLVFRLVCHNLLPIQPL